MLLPKSPIGAVYHWGDRINKWLQQGQRIENAKVVSIGNITSGGTGKTPAVIYFAKLLQNENYNVAILSRGYRGSKSSQGALVSNGKQILLTAAESGDEPYLTALNLKDIPMAIGKDRFSMSKVVQEKFGSDLFVLDDGFQHYALKRDVDIVLVDAVNPFGSGSMLPHGILREPLDSLKRADIIIITKADLVSALELQELEQKIKNVSKHHIIFKACHKPTELVRLPSKEENYLQSKKEKLEILQNKEVWALAGIGSHRSFEKSLQNLGVSSVNTISFRDHHDYSEKDINNILIRLNKKDFVITTEKDWIRLKKYHQKLAILKNFYFLKIEFSLLQNEILLKEGLKANILTGKKSE